MDDKLWFHFGKEAVAVEGIPANFWETDRFQNTELFNISDEVSMVSEKVQTSTTILISKLSEYQNTYF